MPHQDRQRATLPTSFFISFAHRAAVLSESLTRALQNAPEIARQADSLLLGAVSLLHPKFVNSEVMGLCQLSQGAVQQEQDLPSNPFCPVS